VYCSIERISSKVVVPVVCATSAVNQPSVFDSFHPSSYC
jgi:hypothetical protein